MGGAGKAVDSAMSSDWGWAINPVAKGWWELAGYGKGLLPGMPALPGTPGAPPPAPEMQDEAIRNAKLAERRRQLGLAGRQSTWLTGARGDTAQPDTRSATLLGGRSTLLGS